VGGYDTAGFAVHGFLLDRGRYKTVDVPGVSKTVAFRVNARGRSWASTRTRVADAMASCSRRVSSRRSTSQAHLPRRWASAARSSAHTSIALRGAPVAFSGGRGVYTPIDFPGGPGDHRVRHQQPRPDRGHLCRYRRTDPRVPAEPEWRLHRDRRARRLADLPLRRQQPRQSLGLLPRRQPRPPRVPVRKRRPDDDRSPARILRHPSPRPERRGKIVGLYERGPGPSGHSGGRCQSERRRAVNGYLADSDEPGRQRQEDGVAQDEED
jgi:hypothetical protein